MSQAKSIFDTEFLQRQDKPMIQGVAKRVFREWGEHTQQLTDCVIYYTLVLDEIKSPSNSAPPCESKVDLRLICEVVNQFPSRIRDARFEWGETTFKIEFDLYKHNHTGEKEYPEIEWTEYTSVIFKEKLEEKGITLVSQPPFWGDILPMLNAIVQTIYNKAEYHPTFFVGLGTEPATESCYLTFSNMDRVNYATLARIAEQSHIVDINATAWEKRLDIRVILGKATPWPLRSLGAKKHTDQESLPKQEQPPNKRRRH